MPLHLDNKDIAIIKSLLKDGRKSFRQISRETGITTPTVKARFERLVNISFIEGVLPVFDFSKVNNTKDIIQIQNINKGKTKKGKEDFHKNANNKIFEEVDRIEEKITNGLAINLECDYCHGPVLGKPRVLKFADLERFFCCNSCKTDYNEKYKGRIESIKRRYEGKSEIEI
ncbi:MAG TPA: AsnC family transcriptional regulator [Nitrososphaeraceae archaeon]|jgi:Lrp/AsnC family leucine-responsive transcriptional regulator|nr:AsnC family transcriptional regulator [Nitrososphaeraceae archaeon]